jgi:exopolysaccharide biosynthesis protein
MDVMSVVFVGGLVTYFMYLNINKVTQNIEDLKTGSFESYASFSAKIQEYIRAVKKDMDEDIECEDPKYCKKPTCDSKQATKDLADLIRKSSFYETMLAKRKDPKEVEAGLLAILTQFDEIVRTRCIDGDMLADELQDMLAADYKRIV